MVEVMIKIPMNRWNPMVEKPIHCSNCKELMNCIEARDKRIQEFEAWFVYVHIQCVMNEDSTNLNNLQTVLNKIKTRCEKVLPELKEKK